MSASGGLNPLGRFLALPHRDHPRYLACADEQRGRWFSPYRVFRVTRELGGILLGDMRWVVRRLRRRLGFSLIFVGILGVVLGITLTAGTLANATIATALPYEDESSLGRWVAACGQISFLNGSSPGVALRKMQMVHQPFSGNLLHLGIREVRGFGTRRIKH